MNKHLFCKGNGIKILIYDLHLEGGFADPGSIVELHGSFRKLGVPYFGVLIIRIPI